MYTSSNTVWLKVLGYAPLSPEIENCWGPRTNEICAESLRATGYLLTIFFASPLICPSKKCRNAVTTTRRERSEAIDRAERQRTPY